MNKSGEEEDFGLNNIVEIFKEESEDIRNKTLGIPFRQLSMSLDRNDMFRRNLGGGAVQDTEKRRICSNIGLSALIPDCYMSHKRLQLTPSIIKNFDDDTVFYIFYSNPKTKMQSMSADELIRRGWLFYTEKEAWIYKNDKIEETDEEKGYIMFDHKAWSRKNFTNFDDIKK